MERPNILEPYRNTRCRMNNVLKWLQRNWLDRIYVLIALAAAAGWLDKWMRWEHTAVMWALVIMFILHTALMTSAWGRKHLYGPR